MTDRQVDVAKRRLQGNPLPAAPKPAIHNPVFWLILAITGMALSRLHVPLRERSDTVAYQGQRFKMARPYSASIWKPGHCTITMRTAAWCANENYNSAKKTRRRFSLYLPPR